jgi:hypothetical protein
MSERSSILSAMRHAMIDKYNFTPYCARVVRLNEEARESKM